MTNRVLVDAGPLVAVLSNSDRHHNICSSQWAGLQPPIATCWPVLIEAAYLLRRQLVGIEKLFAFFDRGILRLLEIQQSELPEIMAIVKRYRNLEAQVADAALVYLAGRENIDTVFTLDRRDFSIYRIEGRRQFQILP